MSIQESELIDEYHCDACTASAGPSTLKVTTERRSRVATAPTNKWKAMLTTREFRQHHFPKLKGKDVTLEYLRSTGFREPILVGLDTDGKTKGLDMIMPAASWTVDNVRNVLGDNMPVTVIDVATQSELEQWTMRSWAEYFSTKNRDRLYNVISLEVSKTTLAQKIRIPHIVRELDWVSNFWPSDIKKGCPRVKLFCLMGVAGSFTNFHIDFGGSSVFYHIVSGSKVFYLTDPTPANLEIYKVWSKNPSLVEPCFLGDRFEKPCYKIVLKQGDTLLIPSGWIHCVYTPVDSLVIGGNFLHSLHIPMQLEITRIEQETGTPIKFRFPSMEKLSWFAVAAYESMGQEKLNALSSIELNGLVELTNYLFLRQQDVRIRKKLDPAEKKAIKQNVPSIAYRFRNGGPSGLSRRLNRMACTILTERGETINEAHRLLSQEDFDLDFEAVPISTTAIVATPQADHDNTLHEATTKELSPNTECTLVNSNKAIGRQVLSTPPGEPKDAKITLAEASANAPISQDRLLKRAADEQLFNDQGSLSTLCSALPRRKLR